MMETVKRYLPAPVKRVIKSTLPGPLVRWLQNYLEERKRVRLFGRMAPLVPAERDMFEGPSGLDNFKAHGEEFLEIYKSVCGLRPDEIMLDVGSDIGRKTLPLTGYFGPAARYEAIELVPAGVKWCSERYTPRFPNFRFQLIDVYTISFTIQEGRTNPRSSVSLLTTILLHSWCWDRSSHICCLTISRTTWPRYTGSWQEVGGV
jgi:hypothetical protein